MKLSKQNRRKRALERFSVMTLRDFVSNHRRGTVEEVDDQYEAYKARKATELKSLGGVR